MGSVCGVAATRSGLAGCGLVGVEGLRRLLAKSPSSVISQLLVTVVAVHDNKVVAHAIDRLDDLVAGHCGGEGRLTGLRNKQGA